MEGFESLEAPHSSPKCNKVTNGEIAGTSPLKESENALSSSIQLLMISGSAKMNGIIRLNRRGTGKDASHHLPPKQKLEIGILDYFKYMEKFSDM